MLEIKEEIYYLVDDKGVKEVYTTNNPDMLLLTPIFLEANIARLCVAFADEIKSDSSSIDRVIPIETVFENSGYSKNGVYREIRVAGIDDRVRIFDKGFKAKSRKYVGLGFLGKTGSPNVYFDGEDNLIIFDNHQMDLINIIKKLSSNHEDITLAYDLKERVVKLVLDWKMNYIIKCDGQEITLSEADMQMIADKVNNKNLVKKNKL